MIESLLHEMFYLFISCITLSKREPKHKYKSLIADRKGLVCEPIWLIYWLIGQSVKN